MAFNLDTSRRLEGNTDFELLVLAVLGADEHDELTSVEWKSELSLASREGGFSVGRCVLGLANRDPDEASSTFGGCGYMVVGAEHDGNLCGVASVDPARYVQLIDEYVGGRIGPRWHGVYVPVNGVTVAVFEVAAPRRGDPIWPLRKSFHPSAGKGGAARGAVLVRKPGKTEPASDTDIDMLSRRAASAPEVMPELIVDVVGDVPLHWFDGRTVPLEAARFADAYAGVLLDAARQVDAERTAGYGSPTVTGHLPGESIGEWLARTSEEQRASELARQTRAQLGGFSLGMFGEPDTRSLDEYTGEVEAWEAKLRDRVTRGFGDLFSGRGYGRVQLRVVNNSNQYLEDVQVKLSFPWHDASASDDEPKHVHWPTEPQPFGQPRQAGSSLLANFDTSNLFPVSFDAAANDLGRRVWVEDGSINLTFAVGALRPQETDTSEAVWVRLPGRPPGGVLDGSWQVTAKGIHDIRSGSVAVPVTEKPVDVWDVIQAAFEAGSE